LLETKITAVVYSIPPMQQFITHLCQSQLGPSEYFCQQHTHSIYAEEAIFIVSVIEHILNFGALQECGVGHQETTQIAMSTLVLGNRDQDFIPVLGQVNNLLAGMEHSL